MNRSSIHLFLVPASQPPSRLAVFFPLTISRTTSKWSTKQKSPICRKLPEKLRPCHFVENFTTPSQMRYAHMRNVRARAAMNAPICRKFYLPFIYRTSGRVGKGGLGGIGRVVTKSNNYFLKKKSF